MYLFLNYHMANTQQPPNFALKDYTNIQLYIYGAIARSVLTEKQIEG